MTRLTRFLTLAAPAIALGTGIAASQAVTLTPQDREVVIESCESGQPILPVAHDNGSPDGMFAVPILDESGDAISAIILTRRMIATLPQCDVSLPVQGFASGTPTEFLEDDAA